MWITVWISLWKRLWITVGITRGQQRAAGVLNEPFGRGTQLRAGQAGLSWHSMFHVKRVTGSTPHFGALETPLGSLVLEQNRLLAVILRSLKWVLSWHNKDPH